MSCIALAKGTFIALLAAGVIGSAQATAPNATGVGRSITVSYRDLDLTKPGDVAVLYHRIQVAAAHLCGPREMGGS